jgi:hypothetical protein
MSAVESGSAPWYTKTATMFGSSRALTLLDHFRTPYEIVPRLGRAGLEELRASADGPALIWPADCQGLRPTATSVVAADGATQIPVFARVVPDSVIEPVLSEQGGGWRRDVTLAGPDGTAIASIWRGQDGSVMLPFDPDEVVLNYWSERYTQIGSGAKARGVKRALASLYYRVRPLLPRRLQIWMRRHFARVQVRSPFPRWPAETGLHDFFDFMFAILEGIAGEPIPSIAPWPGGHSWAIVLTHDVEQAEGLAALDPVLELERSHGVRSSWNLVPRRYAVDPERLRALVADGFEVGVHGLHHDGRDLESFATWQARLPGIHDAATRWGAVGFRSPALHRHWDWMQVLDFDYDSSYPDTDPFEPQDGGCCTWLPFFNGGIVELPLTLAQDHTLFVILRHEDETAWVEKAEFLRERGGMALIDTHPDYLIDPRILRAYACFLERFASDDGAWRALPHEVSAWWRRRAATSLKRDGDGWRLVGPGAGEGRVAFLGEGRL